MFVHPYRFIANIASLQQRSGFVAPETSVQNQQPETQDSFDFKHPKRFSLPPEYQQVQLPEAPKSPEEIAPWLFYEVPSDSSKESPQSKDTQGSQNDTDQKQPDGKQSSKSEPSPEPQKTSSDVPLPPDELIKQPGLPPVQPKPQPQQHSPMGDKTYEDYPAEEDLPPLNVPDKPPTSVRGFDDNVIRTLNIRLEDPDWMRRSDAANDFYMIVEANPNLERRKQYKPYLDAFELKILRDPASSVHEPVLRAMQVGAIRYPAKDVLNELERLRDSAGMMGLEAQIVDDAIYGIQKSQYEDAMRAKDEAEEKHGKKPKNNVVKTNGKLTPDQIAKPASSSGRRMNAYA